MSAVVFDTLILSRKLAATGMPTEQAQGVAVAIAETLGEQIATRRDLEDVRRDIREVEQRLIGRIDQVEGKLNGRIDQVEAKLGSRIDQVEAKLGGRIDKLEAKLDGRIDQVLAELRQSEQRQTIRLGMMLAGGIAIVAALVKLL